MSYVISVPGEVRGKGRPRFGNGRTFTDSKTLNAEAWVRHCAIEQVGQVLLTGPLVFSMAITVGIPASWSKRKQADAMAGIIRPTGKPDADNSVKLACDALNKVVWLDDSQLVDVRVTKHYGASPRAVLTVQPLAEG